MCMYWCTNRFYWVSFSEFHYFCSGFPDCLLFECKTGTAPYCRNG